MVPCAPLSMLLPVHAAPHTQAEDEIASGPVLSDALAIPGGPAPSSSESFRKRHRKPQRGPSSTMLAGMEMLASAGVDPSLFNSLLNSKAGGWACVGAQGLAERMRRAASVCVCDIVLIGKSFLLEATRVGCVLKPPSSSSCKSCRLSQVRLC